MSRPAPTIVTSDDIAEGLVDLGLAGRTLMVHSSLSAFGRVDGGADAVIEALERVVGSATLVMPSFAWCADEDDGGATLPRDGAPIHGPAAHRPFDPAATPADTGRTTDAFWRRPGVLRSAHPTHALAAIGPRAAAIVEGHTGTRCCPWDGPYGRMTDLGGWVVLLGVGVDSLTFLHALEDRANSPYLQCAVAFQKRSDGDVWAIPQTHYPSGHRDFYMPVSRVAAFLSTWPSDERRVAVVGRATITALSMAALRDRVGGQMAADPAYLLCESAACDFCAKYRRGLLGALP